MRQEHDIKFSFQSAGFAEGWKVEKVPAPTKLESLVLTSIFTGMENDELSSVIMPFVGVWRNSGRRFFYQVKGTEKIGFVQFIWDGWKICASWNDDDGLFEGFRLCDHVHFATNTFEPIFSLKNRFKGVGTMAEFLMKMAMFGIEVDQYGG